MLAALQEGTLAIGDQGQLWLWGELQNSYPHPCQFRVPRETPLPPDVKVARLFDGRILQGIDGSMWQQLSAKKGWESIRCDTKEPQVITPGRDGIHYILDQDNRLWESKSQCKLMDKWPLVRMMVSSSNALIAEDLSGIIWRDHGIGGPRKLELGGPTSPFRQMAACHVFWMIVDSEGVLWVCDWDVRQAIKIRRVEGLPPFTQVATRQGGASTIAVDEDGHVWQGNDTLESSNSWKQMETLSDITKVWAGWDHCIAQDSSGQLWGWGRNQSNELGLESERDTKDPCLLSMRMPVWRAKSARSAIPL